MIIKNSNIRCRCYRNPLQQGKTIFPNIYHKDCLHFKSQLTLAFFFLIIQSVSSCFTWKEMKILAHWQEKINAIHDCCVFIKLLHAVYITEAFVEVYIDIVPQMHLEICCTWSNSQIFITGNSLFRIPKKDFTFLKLLFLLFSWAQMLFCKNN